MVNIRVSPEQLRSVATSLDGQYQEIANVLRNIVATVDGLQSEWTGLAQVDYAQTFHDQVPPMQTRLAETMEHLINDLRHIADEFERADQTAVSGIATGAIAGAVAVGTGTGSSPAPSPSKPETSETKSQEKTGDKTAKINPDASTRDCVEFVKQQPGRHVPSGFNQNEFYSGKYKDKSGTLADGTKYAQAPQPGAIMVESPNANAGISYGHASYVHTVNYDDSGHVTSFEIVEGNWGNWAEDGQPPPVHAEKFHWDEGKNYYVSASGKRSPDMFIL